MGKFKILVADDNKIFAESAKAALKDFQVDTAHSIPEIKEKLYLNYDVILLDLVFDENFPDKLEGLELIPFIHANHSDVQIVVMTNYNSNDIIVSAIKAGAVDFLNKKELKWTEWKIRIEGYCKSSTRIKQLEERNKILEEKYDPSEIIGISAEIKYIKERIEDLAKNSEDVSLLITGETGTGKNLAAKYFRKHSTRYNKPYVEFSIFEIAESIIESELFGHVKGAFTGAIEDKNGLFEEADRGILFLDEIGDYDLKIQKKIMRFLEEKVITHVGGLHKINIDVQLILATNQNLPKLIEEGKFRSDLYHRINRINIHIPPLRDRREDIRVLVDYYFSYFKRKEKTNLLKISEEVYEHLHNYHWPGNVRELQSVILDACTRARLSNDKILNLTHLRSDIVNSFNEKSLGEEENNSIQMKKAIVELAEIERVLKETNGKKGETAKRLNMSIDSLRYTIYKYFQQLPSMKGKYPYIDKYYKTS